MKFTDLEDAGTLNERLDRIEKAIDKLNDRFDQWLRWVIGLQLGAYILIIGGYFLRK